MDTPLGFDLTAEDDATEKWWTDFMESVPSFRDLYRQAEAAGFKRGFEAARAQLLRAMAEAPITAEPQPLRIEGPKAAPPPPEPAPPPPVAAPALRPAPTPPPAAAVAPSPPTPEPVRLPIWSAERDEVVTDGWVCHIPDERIAAAVNALPGPLVHASEVQRRAITIRCQRTAEYGDGCLRVYDLAVEAGWNWLDTVAALYDYISIEDEKKREAKRQAKATALGTAPFAQVTGPAAQKELLGERVTLERRALLEAEYPAGVAIKGILGRFNALPGRKLNESEMRMLANELGLRRPPNYDHRIAPDTLGGAPAGTPKWTDERKAYLTAHYPTGDLDAMLAALNRMPGESIVMSTMKSYASAYMCLIRAPSPASPPPAVPQAAAPPPSASASRPAAPAGAIKLPAPREDGRIYATLPDLMRWANSAGFKGFDGSNVDALNRWCVATLRPSVVVEG